MRIYHQLYRQKNPASSRRLSGARKKVHTDLMQMMRVRNPEDAYARAIAHRGQAMTPGVVTDRRAAKSIGQKWKQALKRLEKMERKEAEKEAEQEVEAGAKAWMERRKARGADPQRLSILRDAAKREIEIRSKERARVGKKPFDAGQRRLLIEDITQGVAAKWNLLGELNRRIAAGDREFVALRNVVAAEIEGRLRGQALDYSAQEALAQLTAAEIQWTQRLLADLKRERGEAAYQPVRGEEFEARKSRAQAQRARGKWTDTELTSVGHLLGLSKAQAKAVASQISRPPKAYATPSIQKKIREKLAREGIKLSSQEFELLTKDPAAMAMTIAAAASRDPDVAAAVTKGRVLDLIRERVARVPQVRGLRERLEKAQAYERESEEILRKSKQRRHATSPWQRSQILLKSEALARKEAADFASQDPAFAVERQRAKPMDIELWDRLAKVLAARAGKLSGDEAKRESAIRAVLKKYDAVIRRHAGIKDLKLVPYIPARFFLSSKDAIASSERKEDGRLAALADDDVAAKQLRAFREKIRTSTGSYPKMKTIAQYREYLARRLYDMVKERWRNALMLMYEKKGGKYLTVAQEKARKRAISRELGAAFPMGGGLFGIITQEGDAYKWKVFGDDGSALMWGKATSHRGASETIGVAHRVTLGLLKEAYEGEPGFDHLPEADRRWLSEHLPGAAVEIKRILIASAGEKRELDVKTMRWLAKKEVIEEPMPVKHGEYTAAKNCKNMSVGDKRVINVKGGKIFVEAARGKIFKTFVLSKDGSKSATYRFKDCDTVMARGAMIAGAMEAGKKVVGAISNPAALKRLENSASKYFRQKNPKLPRSPAEEGTIEDLTGMIGLPDDSSEAYRLGYYAGIIKGIDTCGVQNYMRRRRLRKDFQQKLLDAVVSHQETLTGPSRGGGRRGTTRTTTSDFDWG